LVIVRLDGGRVGERLLEWPALAAVAVSAIAGLATLDAVRRSRFETARYYSSAAVASIVVGWALAQRPELLPNLTVDEAAAGHPTMIATVVGIAIGAAILVPSLALLFGLVLRGRFDAADAEEEPTRKQQRSSSGRSRTWALALGAGALGLGLTLVFDDGLALAVGVVGLLSFVALGAVALVGEIAKADVGED
jgi:cytochrome d ubiquinol oxidase subunit II